MSVSIWKYSFEPNDATQTKSIPYEGDIVNVASQDDKLCMWVKVNPSHKSQYRHFRVLGTGHIATDGEIYIGTAHMPPFVWHLFELKGCTVEVEA